MNHDVALAECIVRRVVSGLPKTPRSGTRSRRNNRQRRSTEQFMPTDPHSKTTPPGRAVGSQTTRTPKTTRESTSSSVLVGERQDPGQPSPASANLRAEDLPRPP